jgi:hypothetical protein
MSARARASNAAQPLSPFGLALVEVPRLDPAATVRDAGQHLFSLFKDELLEFQTRRSQEKRS